jgi:TIR domain
MASVRQYFETDFNHVVRIYVKFAVPGEAKVEGSWLVDFLGNMSFLSCYVPGQERGVDYFLRLLRVLEYGKTQLTFQGNIGLPSARQFPGKLRIENTGPFGVYAQFFGDPGWMPAQEVQTSRRVFIYSETRLTDEQILKLKAEAIRLGHEVQFRSDVHAMARSKFERPLAFISYDSKDREIAKAIAIGLQRMMCPVWYDEFSLKVGDNLRDSIEGGLKKCRKCILVLTPNFFSNGGWTKKEFDSVFTREILEQKGLALPVWCGVGKQAVYDYSASLLNVKGLDWSQLGVDEVCRKLHIAIESVASDPPQSS